MARVSKGTYPAVARKWDLGTTKSQREDNQVVAVQFEIMEGEFAGSFLTWRGYFTEKAEKRTLESLRHCGWTCNDLSVLTGMGSTQVEIVVDDEQGQDGKTYTKVQWVNRAGGAAGIKLNAPMDERQKKAFAARMKGAAAGVPVGGGPAAKAAPPPSRGEQRRSEPEDFGIPAGADDEIPF